MKRRITIVEGDLTAQEVDAIVNAANSALVLGAGVAGAIRARGGPEHPGGVRRDSGRSRSATPRVTGAGELPARFVIHAAEHAAGRQRERGERARVDAARASSSRAERGLPQRSRCRRSAPGIAGFPLQRCAEILLEEARRHLAGETSLEEIRFVLFGEPAYRVFEMVNDAAKVAEQMERLARRGSARP